MGDAATMVLPMATSTLKVILSLVDQKYSVLAGTVARIQLHITIMEDGCR